MFTRDLPIMVEDGAATKLKELRSVFPGLPVSTKQKASIAGGVTAVTGTSASNACWPIGSYQ